MTREKIADGGLEQSAGDRAADAANNPRSHVEARHFLLEYSHAFRFDLCELERRDPRRRDRRGVPSATITRDNYFNLAKPLAIGRRLSSSCIERSENHDLEIFDSGRVRHELRQ